MAKTKNRYVQLFEKSGLIHTEFCKKYELSDKTLRSYTRDGAEPMRAESRAAIWQAAKDYKLTGLFKDMNPETELVKIQFTEDTEKPLGTEEAGDGATEADYAEAAARLNATKMYTIHENGRLDVAEEYVDAGNLPDPYPFSGATIHNLRQKLNLPVAALATQLGVTPASVYDWVSRDSIPLKDEVHRALLYLWREAGEPKISRKGRGPDRKLVADNGTPVNNRGAVPAQQILSLTTKFFETEQAELNKQLVSRALSFVSKEHKMDQRQVRLVVASFLAILKDRFDTQELYSLLTGHSR